MILFLLLKNDVLVDSKYHLAICLTQDAVRLPALRILRGILLCVQLPPEPLCKILLDS